MSFSRIVHLLALVFLIKADCEFYMVGNTKWIFPTSGELRKVWLRTAFDNVNISIKFDYNREKNLFEHEHLFRNPLKNTWYELELQQNVNGGDAVIQVRNSRSDKTVYWQLPHKRYENIVFDADEHVLLSVCDPQHSGLHTVIGDCTSGIFTSNGNQSD
ncbi:unnamed protein product, partial [Meganyctiphanes norvegica]